MKPLNYLHINLSTGKIRPLPIKEGVVRAYLGGKTLAAKLLYDLLPKGVDPLSKENILIINTGIMKMCIRDSTYSGAAKRCLL